MVSIVKIILRIYFNVPPIAKRLLPTVILEHLVAAFCINIAAYLKKVDHLHFDKIGQFISLYYWGCLLGALLGGVLTLRFRTTTISGIGLILLGGCISVLFSTMLPAATSSAMFMMGIVGTTVATGNISSLIRTAQKNERARLKLISLELILFNLSFSFVTFIVLDLNSTQIGYFIKALCVALIITGIYSYIFHTDKIFEPILQSSKEKINLFPKRKKEFVGLMLMVFYFGLIFSMVKVVFTPTLIERFGSSILSVTAASVNPWVMFLVQPLIIEKIKDNNSSWFLGVGCFIVGFGYFIFGLVNSFLLTVIVLVILSLGEMMFAPLSKDYSVQLYGKGQDGVASGVWRAIFLGSGTIGPQLSGYLTERFGSYLVWDLCALLGFSCLIISMFLRKLLKNAHEDILLETFT